MSRPLVAFVDPQRQGCLWQTADSIQARKVSMPLRSYRAGTDVGDAVRFEVVDDRAGDGKVIRADGNDPPQVGAESPECLHEALAAANERVKQLQRALDNRVMIEQAKGMLAERHDLTLEQAFERLRSFARSHRARVVDVARDVVNGHDIP